MNLKKLSKISDSQSFTEIQLTPILEWIQGLREHADEPYVGNVEETKEFNGHEFYFWVEAKKMPTEDEMGNFYAGIVIDGNEVFNQYESDCPPGVDEEMLSGWLDDLGLMQW